MKRVVITCLLAWVPVLLSAQITGYEVGDIAPNFTGIEPDGTTHKLYDYTASGQYVLLDFFAYWCGPCYTNAGYLQAFYEKYGCNNGTVAVLGNECDVGGSNDDLNLFFELSGLDPATAYPSWSGMDGNGADVCNIYSPAAYPTVVLIGPDNRFISIDIWPIASLGDIEDAFPNGVLMPIDCNWTSSVSDRPEPLFGLSLWPNPASEKITISMVTPAAGAMEWSLVSLTGVPVQEGLLEQVSAGRQQQTICLQDLPSGLYVFHYSMNGQDGSSLLQIQ